MRLCNCLVLLILCLPAQAYGPVPRAEPSLAVAEARAVFDRAHRLHALYGDLGLNEVPYFGWLEAGLEISEDELQDLEAERDGISEAIASVQRDQDLLVTLQTLSASISDRLEEVAPDIEALKQILTRIDEIKSHEEPPGAFVPGWVFFGVVVPFALAIVAGMLFWVKPWQPVYVKN